MVTYCNQPHPRAPSMSMQDGTFSAPGIQKLTEEWGHMVGRPAGCQARDILDRVGDKWSMVVISLLAGQTMRFMALRHAVPDISQRMLTVTLRHLERDGIVQRTAYPTVPTTVEYHLTELGTTLLDRVRAIVRWAVEHELQIAAARAAYDARNETQLAAS